MVPVALLAGVPLAQSLALKMSGASYVGFTSGLALLKPSPAPFEALALPKATDILVRANATDTLTTKARISPASTGAITDSGELLVNTADTQTLADKTLTNSTASNGSALGRLFGGNHAAQQPAKGSYLAPVGPGRRPWLNLIPFGGFWAYSYLDTNVNATHPTTANIGFLSAYNTVGSGVFGAAKPDVSIMSSLRKKSFLTSTTEGELDGVISITRQGHKGDTGAFIADVKKVKTGTTADTGGAIGNEFSVGYVDTSENYLNRVHVLSGFMESAAGVSGGAGYGSYNESYNGTNYAAYYGGSLQTYDANSGWQWLLMGTNSRTVAGQYFRIRGDKTRTPGDIVQGFTGATKTIRTTGGNLQILDSTEKKALVQVTDTGDVTFPNSPAWASYTPTISCGTGTIGSASAIGNYSVLGKTTNVRIQISVATIGTCGATINVSLPAAVAGMAVFNGHDGHSGRFVQGVTGESGSSTVYINDYSNAFPFMSGTKVAVSGTYESQ